MTNTLINRLFDFKNLPPPDGLVAAWNLEGILDSFGGQTLTNNGGVTFTAGKINNAATFDGVNDYLSRADNAALSFDGMSEVGTICGWFKVPVMPVGAGPIIAKLSAAGNREYEIAILGSGLTSNLAFFASTNGTALTSVGTANNSIFANVWYFFVAWLDGSKIYLELNSSGSIATTAFVGSIFNGNSEFRIGSEQESGTFLNGQVDAVRFYKRVLTATERSTIYNNGIGREYAANNLVLSDEVNRELDQLINLFNGITKDTTLDLRLVPADSAAPFIINQNGSGPVAQFYSGLNLRAEILNTGQFKSYVATGTAPFLMTSASPMIANLNVDLLDGLHADAFLQITAIYHEEVNVFFDGVPSVGDRRFVPAYILPATLVAFSMHQRGVVSVDASTSFAIRKDNASETLVANISFAGNTNVPVRFEIFPAVMDTSRLIVEVTSSSGATKHTDITVCCIYKYATL